MFWDPSGGFRGHSTLRKFLGSKEHLDQLKIDFNVVHKYYNKKRLMWMELHIYSVKVKSQAHHI